MAHFSSLGRMARHGWPVRLHGPTYRRGDHRVNVLHLLNPLAPA